MTSSGDFGQLITQINQGSVSVTEEDFYTQLSEAVFFVPGADVSDPAVVSPSLATLPDMGDFFTAYTAHTACPEPACQVTMSDLWCWLVESSEISGIVIDSGTHQLPLTRDDMAKYYHFCDDDQVVARPIDASYQPLMTRLRAQLVGVPQVTRAFVMNAISAGQYGILVVVDTVGDAEAYATAIEEIAPLIPEELPWMSADYHTEAGKSMADDYEPFYVQSYQPRETPAPQPAAGTLAVVVTECAYLGACLTLLRQATALDLFQIKRCINQQVPIALCRTSDPTACAAAQDTVAALQQIGADVRCYQLFQRGRREVQPDQLMVSLDAPESSIESDDNQPFRDVALFWAMERERLLSGDLFARRWEVTDRQAILAFQHPRDSETYPVFPEFGRVPDLALAVQIDASDDMSACVALLHDQTQLSRLGLEERLQQGYRVPLADFLAFDDMLAAYTTIEALRELAVKVTVTYVRDGCPEILSFGDLTNLIAAYKMIQERLGRREQLLHTMTPAQQKIRAYIERYRDHGSVSGGVMPRVVRAVEQNLGVQFSDQYRAFLLAYGSGGILSLDILGVVASNQDCRGVESSTQDLRYYGDDINSRFYMIESVDEWYLCGKSDDDAIYNVCLYEDTIYRDHDDFDTFLLSRIHDAIACDQEDGTLPLGRPLAAHIGQLIAPDN